MTAKPKILLMDEDPADRALAATVLSSAFPGSFVCEVGHGAHFISALKNGFYDAVVTELGIEGANSSFLLEAIRAVHEKVAIIVFTRAEDPEAQRGALEAGAAAFVVKSTQGYLDLATATRNVLERTAPTPGEWQRPDTAPGFLPVAEAEPREDASGRSRLAAVLAGTRSLFDHRLGRPIAIFLGIVAISAVVSLLLGTFTRSGTDRSTDDGAFGIVAAGTAEADDPPEEPPAEPPTDRARSLPPAGSIDLQAAEEPATENRQQSQSAPVTLELRASDTVWILVKVDGLQTRDAIMEAGQSCVFTGQKHVEVLIGNAEGMTVIWNGSDIGKLGRPDQVRRFYFTPTEVGVGRAPTG